MKKYLMIFAALLMIGGSSVKANANDLYETKHELGLSTGIFTNSQVFNFLTDVTATLFTLGHVSTDDKNIQIPIEVEYYYHVSKVVGIGAIASFTSRNVDVLHNNEKMGKDKRTFYTFMPSAKFDWLRKRSIGLYSKIGVGVSYVHEKATKTDGIEQRDEFLPTWQLSLVGFEFGNEKFRGFTELGFGEQGVAVLGVRYKF